MDNLKICSRCKIQKEIQFFKRSGTRCKDCISLQSKEYRSRPEIKLHYDELGKIYYSKPENKKRQNEWRKLKRLAGEISYRRTKKGPKLKKEGPKLKKDRKSKLVEINGEICKPCTKCKEVKSLSKFSRSKSKNRRSACKSCCNKQLKDYQKNGWGRVNYNRRRKVEPYLEVSSIVFLESYNLYHFSSQDFKCEYCSSIITEAYHLDHIIPVCKGGTNSLDNLAIACKECNGTRGKWMYLLEEWKPELVEYIEDRNKKWKL